MVQTVFQITKSVFTWRRQELYFVEKEARHGTKTRFFSKTKLVCTWRLCGLHSLLERTPQHSKARQGKVLVPDQFVPMNKPIFTWRLHGLHS
jgi:hypothetical protein